MSSVALPEIASMVFLIRIDRYHLFERCTGHVFRMFFCLFVFERGGVVSGIRFYPFQINACLFPFRMWTKGQ